ncbi:hypothetical protein K490DRAFT_67630 [Saccharata proteae CBS 121410]|uniref:DUF8035 domain-containing protein n=1 Tax=Saccharata proteae CBS 121410 TaxID=1314787 RepID=A0A9P4LWV0_9PEZI|nr:hypothetical protein K490DRAFT_67630 [Saccharata proteae CBS 121410]
MDPRYHHRPSSPGGRRLVVPGRSSTGTFAGEYDQYYNTSHRSPRTSAERIVPTTANYSTQPSAATRSSAGYDSYTGRPRRATLTDDRSRPASTLTSGTPIRTTTHSAVVHAQARPSSPLTRTYDTRPDQYITPGSSLARPSSRQGHTHHSHRKIYSIDDGKAVRVDPREADTRKRESATYKAPAAKSYHTSTKDFNNDDYSYTDPASMYRDTEPRWRQRSGSVERGSRRPVSMLESYGPRTSLRDFGGPPVTTRGFDKLNVAPVARTASLRDHHRTPHSRETSRERSSTADNYVSYRDDPYGAPQRASSLRQPAAYVHQDSDDRRDDRYGYRDEYDDRREGRRSAKPFEDRDVESRGFGIRPIPEYQQKPRDDTYDRRPPPPAPAYPVDPAISIPSVRDYMPEPPRDEARWEQERIEREYRDRDVRERERPRDREKDYDTDRESHRRKDYDRCKDVDRDRHDRDRDHLASGALPVAAAAAAAAGVAAYGGSRGGDRSNRDYRPEDDEERARRPRQKPSDDSVSPPRRRHYANDTDESREHDDRRQEPRDSKTAEPLDPDEEYRRRVQKELERSSGGTSTRTQDGSDSERSDRERERRRRERHERHAREDRERAADGDRTPRDRDRHNSVFEGPMTDEPASMSASAVQEKDRDGRVRIVSPPRHDKDSPPPPKGILRRPTEKFPEDPNPIREGVAPLNKDKDIPPNARWTKIARKLVNPEALEEAKERFEERMDCVIVLRVLTKEQIQELATRTKELRKARGKYIHSSTSTQYRPSPLPSQRATPSAARSSLEQAAAKGNIYSPPPHANDLGERPSRSRRESLSNGSKGVRFTPSVQGGSESRKKQREREDRDDKTVYRRTPAPKTRDLPSDDEEQQEYGNDRSSNDQGPRAQSFPSLLSPILNQVINSLTRQKEEDHQEHRHERRHRHRDRGSDDYDSESDEAKPRMLEAAPPQQARSERDRDRERPKEEQYSSRK